MTGVQTCALPISASVIYSLAVSALIYKESTAAQLFDTIKNAAVTTAQVMIILSAASVLSWFLTSQGLALTIANSVLSLSSNPYHVFFLINVTVLIVGMFIDAASIMVILAPLFYKIGIQVGINPIHLGAVLTVNGAVGMFTPPFGLNLFVASSLGDVDYIQAVRGSLPFIVLALIALAILTYVPEVSMWLPRMVYKGIV